MAENSGNNGRWNAIGMIIKPFLVYYAIYFITSIMLTCLVISVSQKAGGPLEQFCTEQEATVRAVIGGLAMLSGILPLFSTFRRGICNHNNRNDNISNLKKEKDSGHKKDDIGQKQPLLNRWGARAFLQNAFVTITLAISSSVALNILLMLLRLTEASETYDQVSAHQYGVIMPVGLFLYGVVSPFAEEVVFRGVIYNRAKTCFSSVTAPMILSSLLFGVYHGNIVQMLYGFLMGMLIAFVYEKCGRFVYAFLFHAAANAAVYVITGSPFLYGIFMTPSAGLILAGISAVLLGFMSVGGSGRKENENP